MWVPLSIILFIHGKFYTIISGARPHYLPLALLYTSSPRLCVYIYEDYLSLFSSEVLYDRVPQI